MDKQYYLPALIVFFVIFVAYQLYQMITLATSVKKERLISKMKTWEFGSDKETALSKIPRYDTYKRYIREMTSFKFININFVIFVSLIFSYIGYREAAIFFNQKTTGVIIAFVIFFAPYVVIDFMIVQKRKKMRKHLPHFLLLFQQTNEVVGNSLETLNIIRDEIKEPIKGYINEFLKNISKKMDVKKAVEIIKYRTENAVFHSFIDNLYTDIEYGKMIKYEIENDIQAAFSHEENYSHRMAENSGSITSVLIVFVLLVIALQRLISMNSDYVNIIRETEQGRLVVNLVLVILIIVFFMIKTSVSYKDS